MSAVRPSKTPAGRLLRELLRRSRDVSAVRPSKSPACSDVMPADPKSKDVIAARCAVVTLAQALTPGTAATMASRTCSVRSQNGAAAKTSSGRPEDFSKA